MSIEKNKILIAEDDPVSLKIVSNYLSKNGYIPVSAKDGAEALEKLKETNFLIAIVDLNMPKLDGFSLIKEMKKLGNEPIVIVQTADRDVKTIVNLMKQGIFDYLAKPVNEDELIIKVAKAFELASLRKMEKAVEKEQDMRLARQLDWNLLRKEISGKKGFDKYDKNLFASLKTSFTQGAGIGTLISLLSLLTQQAKKEDDKYIVPAGIMELVVSNTQMAEKALKVISEIDELIQKDFRLVPVSLLDLYELIKQEIKDLDKLRKIKNQTIKISDPNFPLQGKRISVNKEQMRKVIREMLLNAFRFSEPESSITILLSAARNLFTISVLSTPLKGIAEGEGIPAGYERVIFEPFFRLTKHLDERFETLDYGLGLTMANKVIQKHKGKINVSTLKDYMDLDQKRKVMVNFEIEIPLTSE
ncbi:MAG: response regulator [Spirochaetia bacterium]|nr:response regulator [Spirochaetia bacterium]